MTYSGVYLFLTRQQQTESSLENFWTSAGSVLYHDNAGRTRTSLEGNKFLPKVPKLQHCSLQSPLFSSSTTKLQSRALPPQRPISCPRQAKEAAATRCTASSRVPWSLCEERLSGRQVIPTDDGRGTIHILFELSHQRKYPTGAFRSRIIKAKRVRNHGDSRQKRQGIFYKRGEHEYPCVPQKTSGPERFCKAWNSFRPCGGDVATALVRCIDCKGTPSTTVDRQRLPLSQ